MIGLYLEFHSDQKINPAFKCPCDRQGLLFYLGITALLIDLLAYVTGLKSPDGFFCIRTTPSLKLLASAEKTVPFSGSYSARACSDAMSAFSVLNTSLGLGPGPMHSHFK